jgi:hypothetical protein
MNNYTVDVSIFLLNEDEFKNTKEKEQRKLVMDVCRSIYAYDDLRFSWDNSVFFSKFDMDEFLKKIKNINVFWKENKDKIEKLLDGSNYAYDLCKKTLQNIWNDYQQPNDSYQQDWRQSFNQQFGIQIWLNDIQLAKNPDVKILEMYGQNFKNTLASITLLNQYVYHPDYDRHLFLYKGLTEFGDELTVISFIKDISIADEELKTIVKNPGKLEGVVKKKSIKSIKETALNFETLEEAVKRARNDFSDNLVFGNDIDKGVKERNKDAGRPPAKVYYYLQTLSEVTEIKRTARPDCSLLLLARMYGCNCSSESNRVQENENCMRKRTWHDGAEYSRFIYHLKPSEGERLNGEWDNFCIRIYFKWSEETKKTIVGWIGKHP